MNPRPLLDLISELRLVEREDGGSTRDRGSDRVEALYAEIERRLDVLRSEGEGFDWIANVLDGRT